ncbi:DUF3352 domain-containing protein [Pontibacter sp. G13]|uniref:DUF3352 domain-containing protein n=1 Tax=Pontibacter sp. G13 TaxID=3074898 RepID=UPI00288C5049|nr:DUF3352 domain-containing protein [Pontibacter sp. G13]WNJ17785.1 DUF3352 domain-containing protein [Pontibacter sp. G13]
MKAFFRFVLLLILLAVAAVAGYFFLESDNSTYEPYQFIPEDFVYIIESDRPAGDWQDMSKTEIWQYLKGSDYFADITESADYLDSLLTANQTLVDLVKLGDMVISEHMLTAQKSDFLILVDLKGKGRKLPKLKPLTTALFKELGYQVETDKFFKFDVYHLYDPWTKETLYLAPVENILIASYTEDLVKRAISQSEKAPITENPTFAKIQEKASSSDLYTIYLNFQTLHQYANTFTTEPSESMEGLHEILSYATFDLHMEDEYTEMEGFVQQIDSVPSYLSVFSDIGSGEISAQAVLPQQTAMFTSIGFEDFADLYDRFSKQLEQEDPEEYEDLVKNRRRIEKLLKIDFDRDFFDWMTEEVVTAVIPVDAQGSEHSYYALLHFEDYEQTKERLDYVVERIGKTPVKFKEKDYKGFTIKYLALKGFFKLFFKKMFSDIEKPHFTYIDDYVVFSNDTTSLQLMIDEYLEQRVLKNDEAYSNFMESFKSSSNVFTYLRNEEFFPYLLTSMDYETRKDMVKNQKYYRSFPQIGFQLYPSGGMYKAYFHAEFAPEGDTPN